MNRNKILVMMCANCSQLGQHSSVTIRLSSVQLASYRVNQPYGTDRSAPESLSPSPCKSVGRSGASPAVSTWIMGKAILDETDNVQ